MRRQRLAAVRSTHPGSGLLAALGWRNALLLLAALLTAALLSTFGLMFLQIRAYHEAVLAVGGPPGWMPSVTLLAGGISVALGIALGVVALRGLARPLEHLIEVARAVTHGTSRR